jgi:hypothetical protein
LPSPLNAGASLLAEVGEASCGSLEALELGVTAWGEEVEGAMAAYVLDEPTPSAAGGGGAACWAGMVGLATAVVMAAVWLRQRGSERAERGRLDCRSVAGLVEEVRNTKRRRRASAKGDQRLVLQGRRSRSQAGTGHGVGSLVTVGGGGCTQANKQQQQQQQEKIRGRKGRRSVAGFLTTYSPAYSRRLSYWHAACPPASSSQPDARRQPGCQGARV